MRRGTGIADSRPNNSTIVATICTGGAYASNMMATCQCRSGLRGTRVFLFGAALFFRVKLDESVVFIFERTTVGAGELRGY